ncbi:MAG: ATPase, T2SS/T4P/T4SS family [Thermoguttaceae bacterium]
MTATAEFNPSQPLLVQLLLSAGVLIPPQLEVLRQMQAKEHGSLETILVKMGLATEEQVAKAYADYLMVPLYDAGPEGADITLGGLLPEKLCRDHLFVPVSSTEDTIDIAFAGLEDMMMVDELQLLTGLYVRPLVARLSVVDATISTLYKNTEGGSPQFLGGANDYGNANSGSTDDDAGNDPQHDEDILDLDVAPPPGQDGHIIRMVNEILEQALRIGASDIHLEPFEDACAVRLRVDGVLRELAPPPRSQFVPVVSRFKILARMDIAEKRVPQDGAIALRTAGKRVDLRVSTVPTVYGEKMVMRLLDKGAIPIELTGLGFDERQSKDLIESIQMPHGLMLVTGPTGSGKSTTLYACLNMLNEPDTNICTVEDPVEYKFKGMNQVQVKTQVGLTFAGALRAFLRQDPDVIMVGEVRDQETAGICLRAALTGHFVLSTIHTNDSLSAVNRLVDMGIEPFLLASTLRVLEAQRLIRKLCQHCREPYDCDEETAKRYGLEAGMTLHRPKGCDHCRGSGYKGRVGVFEVIRITSRMASLIQAKAPLPQLRTAAREQGMKLLLDSGLDKVRSGASSLEEVLTVATSEEE